jgi:hypothetical protein
LARQRCDERANKKQLLETKVVTLPVQDGSDRGAPASSPASRRGAEAAGTECAAAAEGAAAAVGASAGAPVPASTRGPFLKRRKINKNWKRFFARVGGPQPLICSI